MPVCFDVKAGKVGNSVRIVLPKPICDGNRIKPGTVLVICADDAGLITIKKK